MPGFLRISSIYVVFLRMVLYTILENHKRTGLDESYKMLGLIVLSHVMRYEIYNLSDILQKCFFLLSVFQNILVATSDLDGPTPSRYGPSQIIYPNPCFAIQVLLN